MNSKFYQVIICLSFFVFLFPTKGYNQFNKDRTVQLTATVTENPPTIKLSFKKFTDATRIRVFRKKKTDASWGTVYSTLANTDSTYTDNAVSVGEAYEYAVVKEGGTAAQGYIFAGINYTAADLHGSIALLVDATYLIPLANEIKQLEADLIGDGWQVHRLVINRTEKPENIRTKIIAVPNVQAVFIFGNVPVPYSGDIVPDGHPDHQGAWACDGYYGDVDGEWYDVAVSRSTASRNENKNEPGDGKFDASVFDSDIDLQVGRVDMTKLPAFKTSDTALLAYYLQKNHNYRFGTLTAPYRALIDDNFPSYVIASSNWRNFCPMVNTNTIVDNTQPGIDYRTTLMKDWYLWSGGAGGGSYNSCGGVITTAQFATDSIKTVFTSIAGSYFGDWDSQNNLLRAALASKPSILTSFWGGIPNWVLHHMALGENIGYGARLTQNEGGSLYEGNFNGAQRRIHIALMGDPTLRMHTVLPAASFTADSFAVKRVKLTWTPSTDNNVVGYHIYRAKSMYSTFGRITTSPITSATNYTDADPNQGNNVYMIRAVKKETTPSGTYFNYSQGIFDSTFLTFPAGMEDLAARQLLFGVYPNPASNDVTIELENMNTYPALATFTNIMGQTIKTLTIENNQTTVDIAGLPTGMYFISIQCNGYSGTKKLLITN